MELKNYETVFILTPVLSEDQMKDAVKKYVKVLKDAGAKIVNEEIWGLKKLAYQIQHKYRFPLVHSRQIRPEDAAGSERSGVFLLRRSFRLEGPNVGDTQIEVLLQFSRLS